MTSDVRVIVIGAGIGGLACAIDLASQGIAVRVVERAARAGGKMRESLVAGRSIDSGPTVFTMRWVFDELFDAAGAALGDYVELKPLDVLARHAWSDCERFDLFADIDRAADAVAAFSGLEERSRFLAFSEEAAAIYRTLREPFLASPRPGPLSLTQRIGFREPAALFGIRPFETLWRALGKSFRDPRLRQLFGRYATYGGSSPFAAPATLMLIAHVEREGVWTVGGGMQRFAEALQRLAVTLGVVFRFGETAKTLVVEQHGAAGVVLASGERLDADAVVVNADASALADGLLGAAAATAVDPVPPRERSLSAVTWALVAEAEGFPLSRHNVFFSDGYAAEFVDLFERLRLPVAPTVYICAQDRGGHDDTAPIGAERLLMLVNAPPTGDSHRFHPQEIAACENSVFRLLERCGLSLRRRLEATSITTPADFHRLFPATGGALYGRASHGWMASFRRPPSHTRIPGLYLAGGGTHPGPACRWRRCRVDWRRSACSRTALRRARPTGWLPLVVRRRPE